MSTNHAFHKDQTSYYGKNAVGLYNPPDAYIASVFPISMTALLAGQSPWLAHGQANVSYAEAKRTKSASSTKPSAVRSAAASAGGMVKDS